jgi:hypothetical protein
MQLEHDGTGSELKKFKKVIPNEPHRCQIFHQASMVGCGVALYLVASRTYIIRGALVHFSRQQLASFNAVLTRFAEVHLAWAYSADANMVKLHIKPWRKKGAFDMVMRLTELPFVIPGASGRR